ncbi:hypothetical protein [Mycoplasma buteonis]|uniref:hypothetical protein n=1 Tax=Mycoplasma buteonis TaxID=171280 RepID=UPI00055CDC8E|nr:hypothetical protein [Mycoplasma buteonis]
MFDDLNFLDRDEISRKFNLISFDDWLERKDIFEGERLEKINYVSSNLKIALKKAMLLINNENANYFLITKENQLGKYFKVLPLKKISKPHFENSKQEESWNANNCVIKQQQFENEVKLAGFDLDDKERITYLYTSNFKLYYGEYYHKNDLKKLSIRELYQQNHEYINEVLLTNKEAKQEYQRRITKYKKDIEELTKKKIVFC